MAFHILITGPKHSGKTSAGRALAKIINQKFYDLDDLMEEESLLSPRELFRKGPDVFKLHENIALKNFLNKNESCVCAAGGGLIDNTDAMKTLSQSRDMSLFQNSVGFRKGFRKTDLKAGFSVKSKVAFQKTEVLKKPHEINVFVFNVFIEVTAETAWNRILEASQKNGLPAFLDASNPRESHLKIHNRRSLLYKAAADITIPAENKTPEAVAREIMQALPKTFLSIRKSEF